MKLELLTKQGNDDKLIVSVYQRELLAVIAPARSDFSITGNIAGCGLIQYLLAGNMSDCLTAVDSTRLYAFSQKSQFISKLLGGHIMPANSLLSFVDKLDRIIDCLRAILQLMTSTPEHNNLTSLIGLICEQLESLSSSILYTLRQEEATI